LRSINILGLQTFGAALNLELHLRAFFQRPIAVHLNRRKMYKHIIAVSALDKPVALGGVKPFHDTFFSHYFVSPNSGPALSIAKTAKVDPDEESSERNSSPSITERIGSLKTQDSIADPRPGLQAEISCKVNRGNGLRTRLLAWWYFSIAAGFLLLAVSRGLQGERWPLILLRAAIAIGFFVLGWGTLRQRNR